jgi:hypothetical protein
MIDRSALNDAGNADRLADHVASDSHSDRIRADVAAAGAHDDLPLDAHNLEGELVGIGNR